MNCDDCQERMSELLDAGQGIRQDAAVEHHLAGCLPCREFHDALAALDSQLTHQAARAVLPTDFKATLLARLPAPQPLLSPAEVGARREQLGREHREALAALQRRYLLLDAATLLRLAAIAGGFIVAAVLLNALVRTLPGAIGTVLGETEAVVKTLALSLGLSLAAVLFGLSRVWRPLRRWVPVW